MKYTSLIPVLGSALVFSACSSKNEENTTLVDHEDEIAIIDVDVAYTKMVEHSQSYTANVEAENVNNIAPAMSNRIKTITVDVGDRVSRGQVLVTLDASAADQQRINLDQTEREYNRAVELLQIGAGTQRSVDQLKAQLDAQRTQYRNTMENTVLRSPISGVVTARNYDPGDMTGAMPVLTVGQITPNVKIVINVNENDLTEVKKGSKVSITLDAYPGEEYQGTISRVSPAVDPATRTFPVEVQLPNPDGKFRPGMFARVVIAMGTANNVVVPDRAVVKQTGSANKYVYVYKNGKVSMHKVQLGQRMEDSYELIEGISEGDSVVVAGQTRLSDGAPAKLNPKNK